MQDALQRAWGQRGALAWLLSPAALLYAAVTALRRALYRAGRLRSTRAGVPVIVVGNVIAGGAGKTPVVIAVLEHLRARGIAAGVVSRGYGRRTRGVREVESQSPAADVGDEPLLVRQRCDVPVFVGERRAEAARALLARHPATQVLVADDGLQHLALHRDLEICVFDDRGIGNGWLLPAGPLREPWPRPVDLVLRPPGLESLGGYAVKRRLAQHAMRADGTRTSLAELRPVVLHAVAGIARPQAFFRMLREAGLPPQSCTALPDHDDFERLEVPPGVALVCTEKDAVKLWRERPDAWAVPLALEIEPAFWREFDRLVDATLSSQDGSQTA
jgi:tetraacyldisaccharide 4'-kinase